MTQNGWIDNGNKEFISFAELLIANGREECHRGKHKGKKQCIVCGEFSISIGKNGWDAYCGCDRAQINRLEWLEYIGKNPPLRRVPRRKLVKESNTSPQRVLNPDEWNNNWLLLTRLGLEGSVVKDLENRGLTLEQINYLRQWLFSIPAKDIDISHIDIIPDFPGTYHLENLDYHYQEHWLAAPQAKDNSGNWSRREGMVIPRFHPDGEGRLQIIGGQIRLMGEVDGNRYKPFYTYKNKNFAANNKVLLPNGESETSTTLCDPAYLFEEERVKEIAAFSEGTLKPVIACGKHGMIFIGGHSNQMANSPKLIAEDLEYCISKGVTTFAIATDAGTFPGEEKKGKVATDGNINVLIQWIKLAWLVEDLHPEMGPIQWIPSHGKDPDVVDILAEPCSFWDRVTEAIAQSPKVKNAVEAIFRRRSSSQKKITTLTVKRKPRPLAEYIFFIEFQGRCDRLYVTTSDAEIQARQKQYQEHYLLLNPYASHHPNAVQRKIQHLRTLDFDINHVMFGIGSQVNLPEAKTIASVVGWLEKEMNCQDQAAIFNDGSIMPVTDYLRGLCCGSSCWQGKNNRSKAKDLMYYIKQLTKRTRQNGQQSLLSAIPAWARKLYHQAIEKAREIWHGEQKKKSAIVPYEPPIQFFCSLNSEKLQLSRQLRQWCGKDNININYNYNDELVVWRRWLEFLAGYRLHSGENGDRLLTIEEDPNPGKIKNRFPFTAAHLWQYHLDPKDSESVSQVRSCFAECYAAFGSEGPWPNLTLEPVLESIQEVDWLCEHFKIKHHLHRTETGGGKGTIFSQFENRRTPVTYDVPVKDTQTGEPILDTEGNEITQTYSRSGKAFGVMENYANPTNAGWEKWPEMVSRYEEKWESIKHFTPSGRPFRYNYQKDQYCVLTDEPPNCYRSNSINHHYCRTQDYPLTAARNCTICSMSKTCRNPDNSSATESELHNSGFLHQRAEILSNNDYLRLHPTQLTVGNDAEPISYENTMCPAVDVGIFDDTTLKPFSHKYLTRKEVGEIIASLHQERIEARGKYSSALKKLNEFNNTVAPRDEHKIDPQQLDLWSKPKPEPMEKVDSKNSDRTQTEKKNLQKDVDYWRQRCYLYERMLDGYEIVEAIVQQNIKKGVKPSLATEQAIAQTSQSPNSLISLLQKIVALTTTAPKKYGYNHKETITLLQPHLDAFFQTLLNIVSETIPEQKPETADCDELWDSNFKEELSNNLATVLRKIKSLEAVNRGESIRKAIEQEHFYHHSNSKDLTALSTALLKVISEITIPDIIWDLVFGYAKRHGYIRGQDRSHVTITSSGISITVPNISLMKRNDFATSHHLSATLTSRSIAQTYGVPTKSILVTKFESLGHSNLKTVYIPSTKYCTTYKSKKSSSKAIQRKALSDDAIKFVCTQVRRLIEEGIPPDRIQLFAKREQISQGLFDEILPLECQSHFFGHDCFGSNRFVDKQALVIVGDPVQNYGSIQEDLKCKTGRDIDFNDEYFQAYATSKVVEQIAQIVRRLRSARRCDPVKVVKIGGDNIDYLIDHFPGCSVETLSQHQLDARARRRTAKNHLLAATEALIKFWKQDLVPTAKQVAQEIGIAPSNFSNALSRNNYNYSKFLANSQMLYSTYTALVNSNCEQSFMIESIQEKEEFRMFTNVISQQQERLNAVSGCGEKHLQSIFDALVENLLSVIDIGNIFSSQPGQTSRQPEFLQLLYNALIPLLPESQLTILDLSLIAPAPK